MEWYDACQRSDSEWPQWVDPKDVDPKDRTTPFTKQKWPVVIALDAAVSGDTFGLVVGCRHPNNSGDVLRLYSQKWAPEPGKKLDFQGTDENPGPEKVLRRLIGEYNVIQVAYDPYQLHDFCNRMRKEGLAWFRPFSQANDRLLSDSQLRDLVRDRRLWHRGEVDSREHFQNADAKIDSEDHKIRIVKRTEKLKVDLCVAEAMETYELLRLNL